MEKPVSFPSGGQRIFGMLHLPEGAGPFPGMVFFHGFTGHRGEIRRLFVKTARAFAKNRIASLRFVFRGCEGENEAIRTSFQWLRKNLQDFLKIRG